MSYETEAHGQVEVSASPFDITIVDDEDWEEPSVQVRVGDKTAMTEDEDGHISIAFAVEDPDGNWGRARVSFNPDEARELGEALVEEADSETKPLFGSGFADLEIENEGE